MNLRIALLMMQKNEDLLLGPWIRYHTNFTANSSIFIFDNGSSKPAVIEKLAEAEQDGIHIIRHYNTPEDYLNTGNIFSEFIQNLDRQDPHDFYFPIDCDEFLACQTQSGLSCRTEDLHNQLRSWLGSQQVLVIPRKHYANPYQPNRYIEINHTQKCFFSQGTCESLSHGFHKATTAAGHGQQITTIIYFEFHHKPYPQHRQLTTQKLEPIFRGKAMSRRNLIEYAATLKTNFHCAFELLQTEYDYIRYLAKNSSREEHRCLLDRFSELQINPILLFANSPLSSKRKTITLITKSWLTKIGDKVNYHRFRIFATRAKLAATSLFKQQ